MNKTSLRTTEENTILSSSSVNLQTTSLFSDRDSVKIQLKTHDAKAMNHQLRVIQTVKNHLAITVHYQTQCLSDDSLQNDGTVSSYMEKFVNKV